MKEGNSGSPFDSDPDSDLDPESGRVGGRGGIDESDVPYAVRRDSVNEDRENLPIWTRPETKARQTDVKAEVEDRLGYDVYLTDFKEAAYLEGLENPAAIAERLESWGCRYA